MSALAAAGRRIRLPRRRLRISRRRMRFVVLGIVIAALAASGGWFLLRDSSFVAVQHVAVEGVEGSDAAAITAALDSAARRMTTLDVQTARLDAAVSGFPDIKGLRVSAHFPHALVIDVIQVVPVAVVQAPGRKVVVSGDGTLLPDVRVTAALPVIPLTTPPTGGTLGPSWAREAAGLLAAAPSGLLARLSEITTVGAHGLVAQVRGGPSIYFGDASEAQAKWAAAVAVLADPGSAGASYIDVTDPGRPAAGTDAQVAQPGVSSQGGSTSSTPAGSASSTPSGSASSGSASSNPSTSSAPTTDTTASGGSTAAGSAANVSGGG